MKTFKFLLLSAVILCVAGCASAQTKKGETAGKNKPNMTETKVKPTPERGPFETEGGALKTIAEGTNSKVEKPFLFVARSAETYALLQNLIENSPSAAEIDWTKTAVVAAFAGTKNTGGYSIDIKDASDKISIDVVSPPKDAMVAQMITNPYKVVFVPVERENNLPLNVSANWKNAMQTFQIAKSEFSYSGGITGRSQSFQATGTIGVINFENYTTLVFNLSGKSAEKNRKLFEIGSGTFKNEKIELSPIEAGSFSENPKPPVKVSGTLSKNKLNLKFEPLPTTIADCYSVGGTIEAVKIK